MDQYPIQTRRDDPQGYEQEARQQRTVDPRYWPLPPASWDIQFRWGDKSVNIRGLAIAFAFIAVVNVAAVVWAGYQTKVAVGESMASITAQIADITKKSGEDHLALRRSTDRNTCMLAMSQDRRERFLEHSGSPGAWGQVCPFIQGE